MVASLLTSAIAVAAPLGTVEAGPAGCVAATGGLVVSCDHFLPTLRLRGAIGLVGDSVLLGSSPGISNPSVPTLLGQQNWGPIRMTTALGMRTRNDGSPSGSAWSVVGRWKAAGFTPKVVAINVGANHLGDCTPTTVAACKKKIDELLNRIFSLWPDTQVWWAKIVQIAYPSRVYTPAMLGWNAALDAAVKARPGSVYAWNWPAALKASDIATDIGGIHPVSGTQYVKRNRLIADNLTLSIRSRFLGPRATAATSSPAGGLSFAPDRSTRIVYSGPLAAGADTVLDMSDAVPSDTGAVALGLTSSKPAGAGYVTLFPCGTTAPKVSSLNFAAGQARSAQAIVRLNPDRRLCARASVATNIRIALQGSFVPPAAGTDTFRFLTPTRLRDTAVTNKVVDHTIALAEPTLAGADIDGAAVTVTIDRPSAGGGVTVYECGAPVPAGVNLSFLPGETAAGAVYVPVSASNTICMRVKIAAGSTFRLIVDRTGVFTKDGAGAFFVPVQAKRMLDTRNGSNRVGGWFGRHQALQAIDVNAAPPGTIGVSGTVTMVGPVTTGYITASGCGPRPLTSTVNGRPGSAAANTATSQISAKGLLCLYSSTNTDTVFDVAGWWQAA